MSGSQNGQSLTQRAETWTQSKQIRGTFENWHSTYQLSTHPPVTTAYFPGQTRFDGC